MSAADNTKLIGLAWPDDRQGSICSLTPLVLSTSAASSSVDLHTQAHKELITSSEVEVQMENPSVSTASESSVKGSGLYKKNTSKQITDSHKNKTFDMFSINCETEARPCSGRATPEYYTGLPLVRTWSNPALSEGGFVGQGLCGTDLTNHGYKQLEGPCCDR